MPCTLQSSAYVKQHGGRHYFDAAVVYIYRNRAFTNPHLIGRLVLGAGQNCPRRYDDGALVKAGAKLVQGYDVGLRQF